MWERLRRVGTTTSCPALIRPHPALTMPSLLLNQCNAADHIKTSNQIQLRGDIAKNKGPNVETTPLANSSASLSVAPGPEAGRAERSGLRVREGLGWCGMPPHQHSPTQSPGNGTLCRQRECSRGPLPPEGEQQRASAARGSAAEGLCRQRECSRGPLPPEGVQQRVSAARGSAAEGLCRQRECSRGPLPPEGVQQRASAAHGASHGALRSQSQLCRAQRSLPLCTLTLRSAARSVLPMVHTNAEAELNSEHAGSASTTPPLCSARPCAGVCSPATDPLRCPCAVMCSLALDPPRCRAPLS